LVELTIRIRAWSNHIGPRQLRNPKKSKISRMSLSQRCSKSRDVQGAVANSTCQAYTSCASILIIRGEPPIRSGQTCDTGKTGKRSEERNVGFWLTFRCLSDADPECPLCARNHSIIREVRRGQTRLADRHDLFLDEVREADDGFAVVAGAFGRGVMGKKIPA
jgi:hypothetical protein